MVMNNYELGPYDDDFEYHVVCCEGVKKSDNPNWPGRVNPDDELVEEQKCFAYDEESAIWMASVGDYEEDYTAWVRKTTDTKWNMYRVRVKYEARYDFEIVE